MKPYKQYEKECKRIRRENSRILADFAKWLSDKRLPKRTIDKHRWNVDLYINDFLLYEAAVEAVNGASEIGTFLGFWFIRKAMWAGKAAIKENAASLKKFYEFMFERGKISSEAFEDLKVTIKDDMPDWCATMDRYDDPDIEDPEEIWGI